MATFAIAAELVETPSNVIAATNVPETKSNVAATDRVLRTPDAGLAFKLVLEAHCVTMRALPPRRPVAVMNNMPMPEPTTVTLDEAVAAEFVGTVELMVAPSIVSEDVKLPSC